MRIIVSLDSQERGDRVLLSVDVLDDQGQRIEGVQVEARDYARGDTEDEGGALYLPIQVP